MKRYRSYIAVWMAGLLGLCTPLSSCNDELEDGLRKDYPESGYDNLEGHVLWIVLNGASGSAVREANNDHRIENLNAMMSHSLYTFSGLADTRTDTVVGNRMGWDNLFTGLLNRTPDTPDILTKLKGLDATCRTEIFASTTDFYDSYARKADDSFWARMSKSRLGWWMSCRKENPFLHLWLWSTMGCNKPVNSMDS